MDEPGAECFRHRCAENKCSGEVEKCRPKDRLKGSQNPRGHDCGDRVCSVVKAIDVIKQEGDGDDDDGEVKGRHQLTVLHYNVLEHIGHVFAAIDAGFDEVVDFLQLDERNGILLRIEQLRHG